MYVMHISSSNILLIYMLHKRLYGQAVLCAVSGGFLLVIVDVDVVVVMVVVVILTWDFHEVLTLINFMCWIGVRHQSSLQLLILCSRITASKVFFVVISTWRYLLHMILTAHVRMYGVVDHMPHVFASYV